MDKEKNLHRILLNLSFAQFLIMQIWYNFSAVLSSLQELWNLTNFQAGMIVSMFQLGYVMAVLFFGFLSDSHSPQKIFITGALITGLSSLLFACFAEGFYSAVLFRTLAGIGMGGVYVPGMRLLAGVFPPDSRGKAMGFYVGSLVVGSGTSLLLSGILAKYIDWNVLIIITSIGALLGAFLVYRLGEVIINNDTNKLEWRQIRAVLTRPNILLNLGYLGHMWELYAVWPWIAPFLIATYKFHGYSIQDAEIYGNIVGGLSIILGSVATWLGGVISDRKGRIKIMQVFLFGSIFCSFTIGWIGEWSVYAAAVMAVFYCFLVIGDSPVFSTAITELVSSNISGLALGFQSVVGFAVTAISPTVFGYLVDRTQSWGLAFATLGLGALLGPVALMKLSKLPESYRMARGMQ